MSIVKFSCTVRCIVHPVPFLIMIISHLGSEEKATQACVAGSQTHVTKTKKNPKLGGDLIHRQLSV